MALSKATGVSAMPTGSATQTISLGFSDGKCAWLWVTRNSSHDAFADDAVFCMGLFDGTDSHAIGGAIQNNVGTMVANRYHYQSKALILLDNTGALVNHCTAAFSGSDLVLTWNSTPATAYYVHYLVLGGTDITGSKLQVFTAKTSTGTQARTGFGFAPDFLYFLTNQDDTSPVGGVGDNGVTLSFGCAANKASRKEKTFSVLSEDTAADSNAQTGTIGSNALDARYMKSGIVTANGNFAINSWDSDGYTENWVIAGGSAWHFAALALKGLQYDIHAVNTPTSTGNESQTGFGFQPEAMLHYCWPSPAASSADVSFGMGACTSTTDEHAAWIGDNDNADPSTVDQRSTATYHLLRADPGTPTVDVEASLVSFDADGFTQNYVTAPAAQKGQGWIAFGPAVATGNRSPAFAQII